MEIKDVKFNIAAGARELDGTKLEPEQQPARIILDTSATVSNKAQTAGGQIAAQVVIERDVNEFIEKQTKTCSECAHFNRTNWQKILRRNDDPLAPKEARQMINNVRSSLLMSQNATIGADKYEAGGEPDIESVMHAMGTCNAIRDIVGAANELTEGAVLHPSCTCPGEYVNATNPSGLFKPKNRTSVMREEILRAAQGKIHR